MSYPAATVKRLRYKIIAAIILLAACLCAALFFTREPSADGRSLSEWLRLGVNKGGPRDNTDVTNAVRKIGARAVPVLLEKLRAKEDPKWRRRLYGTFESYVSYEWAYSSRRTVEQGRLGFFILGPDAAAAIPELNQMLGDGQTAWSGAAALYNIGAAAEPVWKTALTNAHPIAQCVGLSYVNSKVPEERFGEFWPQILLLCRSTNREVRLEAVRAVSARPERPESKAVLIEALGHSDVQTVIAAPGPWDRASFNARPLVPMILSLLQHSDSHVRDRARFALRAIDPALDPESTQTGK